MRIAGHTLGTPEQTVPEALALFAGAGLDAAELIYQDGYRSGLPLRDRRAADQARKVSDDLGIPIVGLMIRAILVIPQAIVLLFLGILVGLTVLVSWIPILLNGRMAGWGPG